MDFKSFAAEELVQKCAQSADSDAWAEFRRRFDRPIAKVVSRVCREWNERSREIAKDLVQETYVKLLGDERSALSRFQPQHTNGFAGYLQTLAANVSHDYFRAQHAQKRNVANTVELNEAMLSGSFDRTKKLDNRIFFKEVDELLRQRGDGPAERRERTIFWLYYRQGFTASEISALPNIGLGVKGVESVIFRLTSFLRRSLVPA